MQIYLCSKQLVHSSLTLSAFGQTIASSGSSTSAYQFGATSGYRTEGDAGLTLVGCRFYDAQVGGFISRDTCLNQKPYVYCDGDPANKVDPTGHRAALWNIFVRAGLYSLIGGAGGTVIGLAGGTGVTAILGGYIGADAGGGYGGYQVGVAAGDTGGALVWDTIGGVVVGSAVYTLCVTIVIVCSI